MRMGQQPSKDKLTRSSSERIDRRTNNRKFSSFSKKSSSAKKDAQVTQVLTASKLSPRPQIQQNNIENKKNVSTPVAESKTKRAIFPKEKVAVPRKECGRSTVKGGGTVPTARPQQQTRTPAPKPQAKVAEGLAILVQHLVFNVGAYQVPTLRRQLENYRLEVEEFKLACQQLEESLADERQKQSELIENERVRCRSDITQVIDQHRIEITKLKSEHNELKERFLGEKQELHEKFNQQLQNERTLFKTEFTKLQKTHQETVDILGEENDAIREQIDEKNQQLEDVKHESMKLKQDYESREQSYKKQMFNLMETIKEMEEEKKQLVEENNRLLGYGDDKAVGMQEVQSLRAVLELKQSEVADLRRALAEATHKADTLQGAEEKAAALLARCEDLQLQLQRKSEYEQNLKTENQRLQVSFKEEINQKRRLSQYNEELQWKLKQNKEVMNKVLEQTQNDDSVFIRSSLSSSYNERHSATKQQFERTLSFRERNSHSHRSKTSLDFDVDEDLSPPSSPKVKIMVEKGDSVSYVLDLEESPELQAQRIVRRSFRNTAMPSKSPTNKRARIRNPLSLSSSSSAILQTSKSEQGRTRTISLQNGDCDEEEERFFSNGATSTPKSGSKMKLELDEEDEDDDIQLPALPSEMGGNKKLIVLPSPKHLAGEAMVSESNSEDESSTSSSQL